MPAAPTRYPKPLVVLHWLMAALIVGMLASGLVAEDLPQSLLPSVMGWHKAIGVAIILLLLARMVVRGWADSTRRTPPIPSAFSPLEAKLAMGVHMALYAAMIIVPLAGWLMVSSSPKGWPIVLWGDVVWPFIPLAESIKPTVYAISHEAHELAAFAMIALLLLHVGAVFKHHFKDGINLMTRMR